MITVFSTAKKRIVFDVFSRGSTFNQLYFIDNIFPNLKTANLTFRRQKKESTFSMHMDDSIYHNGLKVPSKIKKDHISRMHPPYSTDISPYDLWSFWMLKHILRDREFCSSDDIEDAIAQIWNDLTFDDVQSVSRDWIRHLAWVAENDGEYISE
jgi:hypothetical protein